MPDFILPKNIAVTANFDDLFVDNFADLILIATPTAALRSNLELIKLDTNDGNICIKGKINSVTYLEGVDGEKENGFFSKLFK